MSENLNQPDGGFKRGVGGVSPRAEGAGVPIGPAGGTAKKYNRFVSSCEYGLLSAEFGVANADSSRDHNAATIWSPSSGGTNSRSRNNHDEKSGMK